MENPQMYPQIRNGSVKECEVYCEDGRRTVRVGVEIGNSLTMMISANSVRWGGDRVMMMMMMMMLMMIGGEQCELG